ncbi:MAG: hypothetical protein IJ766_01260 [Clostridia bacterium]|nr:hypothetical protein [Clostridia bacterium]
MQYYFYLNQLLLPVAPAYFQVHYPGKNKTYDLAAGGEIVLPEQPGLCEYSFGVLLPSVPYPFAQYSGGFLPPEYYIRALMRLRDAAAPFDLLVIRTLTADTALRFAARLLPYGSDAAALATGSPEKKIHASDARIILREGVSGSAAYLFDTTARVTLEELTITEDAETYGGDFFAQLRLKQYRPFQTVKGGSYGNGA